MPYIIVFIHNSNGADKRIRTSDLRITNAPLYQLSYVGSEGRQVYSNRHPATTTLRALIRQK